MPSFCRIEVAESSDATPAKRKVGKITMLQRAGSGPKVESGGGPNAVIEVALELGVRLE